MPELSSLEAAVPVEIESTGGRHQLLRDGRPYHIKGAGISDAGEIEKFAEQGGNSLRVWTTNNGALSTGELLDRAHEHGVTVALCIEMGIERLGFDYTDRAAVSAGVARRSQPAWIFAATTSVEIRADPHVVHADQLDRIVDVIHEFRDVRARERIVGFSARAAGHRAPAPCRTPR